MRADRSQVEPSVSNTSDPNYHLSWDFCEFTFNSTELFINISYVDFVSLPISLTVTDTNGTSQHVSGLPSNGLATVCSNLTAQNKVDGAGWDQLIIQNEGQNLRALSPNTGIIMNANLFTGLFQSYVNQVWNKYTSQSLQIDTQAQWGVVSGKVVNGLLTFTGVGTFAQPGTRDIFSCSTGPFAASPTNTGEMGNIGARLAAAFNRSTLLIDSVQPDDEIIGSVSTFLPNFNQNPTHNSTLMLPAHVCAKSITDSSLPQYYATSPTNHYARIVHAANLDGRGYAFPYDDVGPSGGADQSGSIADGSPSL
jgi:hypothetical protein